MAMAGMIVVIVVLTQLGGWLTASNNPTPVPPTPAPAPPKPPTNPTPVPPTPAPPPRSLSPTRSACSVSIEPGEFLMGSPESDTEASSDEKPQHRVRITEAFSLGIHEVTQGQYQAVMGENPSNFKGSRRSSRWSMCPGSTPSTFAIS